MTRAELIARLEAYEQPSRWTAEAIAERDHLLFGCWWYGCSTHADKAKPGWPGEDYIASKRSSEPAYLTSIDAALTLVPDGFRVWTLHNYHHDKVSWFCSLSNSWDRLQKPNMIHVAASGRNAALAVVIAALKAREKGPALGAASDG
jgi:hypothetical protein